MIPVPFRSSTLYVVESGGEPYVPMKPVVEGMGLNWATQFTKMKANPRWGIVEIAIPSVGGAQGMSCLPLRKLPGWLMTIYPNKVNPAIRDSVIAYQNDSDDILWAAWNIRAVDGVEYDYWEFRGFHYYGYRLSDLRQRVRKGTAAFGYVRWAGMQLSAVREVLDYRHRCGHVGGSRPKFPAGGECLRVGTRASGNQDRI